MTRFRRVRFCPFKKTEVSSARCLRQTCPCWLYCHPLLLLEAVIIALIAARDPAFLTCDLTCFMVAVAAATAPTTAAVAVQSIIIIMTCERPEAAGLVLLTATVITVRPAITTTSPEKTRTATAVTTVTDRAIQLSVRHPKL